MKTKDDISDRLTASQRARYNESMRRMVPTILALRFGNVESLAQKTPEAKQLASVAKAARAAWESIHEIHWRSAADTTATEAGRLTRSAAHAKRQIKMVSDRFESAFKAADAKLTQLKGRIDDQLRPPQHVGRAHVAAEARAFVRTLAPGKVVPTVRGDDVILDAVVSAPAALSGVTKENWEALRAEYLAKKIPDTFEEYNDLRAAAESAITAEEALTREANALIDFKAADALEGGRVTV